MSMRVAGMDDAVTDPGISQLLHDSARSEDKTLKLYDGMWHALLIEPEGGGERVLQDIVEWITARARETTRD